MAWYFFSRWISSTHRQNTKVQYAVFGVQRSLFVYPTISIAALPKHHIELLKARVNKLSVAELSFWFP